jgi:polyphosphate kinase
MQQHELLPTLPSLLVQPNVPFIHRDLSWLQFNERVLAEARQTSNPLLERAKFLAISAANLDEFFMIRLASLERTIASAVKRDPDAGSRLHRIHSAILEAVAKFGAKQAEALDLLAGELEGAGVFIVRKPQPGTVFFDISKKVFDEQVLQKLSPPEPFASSKFHSMENLQLVALLKNNQWLRIPKSVPSLFCTTEDNQLYAFFLDDLLATHLGSALAVQGVPSFLRLTRDGDFTVDLEEEDSESIPDVVRTGLGSREKGRPVRLQYWGDFPQNFLQDAMRVLKLDRAQILPAPQTMCLHGLWNVVKQAPDWLSQKAELQYPALNAKLPLRLRDQSKIFDEIREADLLLHHPYDSFDGFVAWIQAACADPNVTMVEQTVYRMDTLSPVIDALKMAAKTKTVRVIIELRARFDELNNLLLAEELRKAGVEVAFGFGALKLHAKVALVTRKEGDVVRLYTHLSTGNYNATTARQYTDLAILTANPEIGADARVFFDAVMKGEIPTSFKQLLSAPARMHRRLLNLIDAETQAAKAGKKGHIVAKVNALVDGAVVNQLYLASQAGVQVDLIVRGACSLIPGVPGLSENIRVISVVDRLLEHSRIYYFENSKALYLSSADWMPRNFFSRLEIAFPVLDPKLYEYISQIVIPTYLADTVKAKELTPQGTWKKRTASSLAPQASQIAKALLGKKPVRSQMVFEELALREYENTPLEKRGLKPT